ncbi:MAG: hypothetical protein INF84_21150 [Roseomonas sp.]|nr:hypothetical protein [Roseomonas sp.]
MWNTHAPPAAGQGIVQAGYLARFVRPAPHEALDFSTITGARPSGFNDQA